MESGDNDKMEWTETYRDCRLCPRKCRVDRISAFKGKKPGFCGETDRLRVAFIGPHFGEEPPITGIRGSGTVFFTGCTLKCTFCQNYQISREGIGNDMDTDQFFSRIKEMVRDHRVHNINFVTPDHFLPHILLLVEHIRKQGLCLPFVYNLSGYQSTDVLRKAEAFADIYLPDFKYSDASLAAELSACRDYPGVALEAIGEMIKQKGFLDACSADAEVAKKGVLVRHLILPGQVENSLNALTSLYLEFGKELPVSMMSQYYPVTRQRNGELNRFVSQEEFDQVYVHARELGFMSLFVQFPGKQNPSKNDFPFLPDFMKDSPFSCERS